MKVLAGIKFKDDEIKKIESDFFNNDKKFIVKYKTIYQIKYSENAGLYAIEVFKDRSSKKIGYVKYGRFLITNASNVNDLIEKDLFV